ncbi:MAG: PIN domain nuclease [Caldilineaceae bacterium]|nr:PIN domain nuclease [Caldilineaceae bacterium]
MWIVDSSVWIDYFNGVASPATDLLDASLGQRELGLVDIVLCEVLQGFRHDADFERARDALLAFPLFTVGGQRLAIQSAVNYRQLRRRGITIRKTIDCLIATFVIEESHILLHCDEDFDPFVVHLGLQVVDLSV